jgi:hypothetical protein
MEFSLDSNISQTYNEVNQLESEWRNLRMDQVRIKQQQKSLEQQKVAKCMQVITSLQTELGESLAREEEGADKIKMLEEEILLQTEICDGLRVLFSEAELEIQKFQGSVDILRDVELVSTLRNEVQELKAVNQIRMLLFPLLAFQSIKLLRNAQ